MKRWPLIPIAAPAAVAVWSGWVGLGGMCGFGIVRPLPGIVDSFTINSAITLPVGVEAYGAYALGAWLTPGTPERARTFARRSAVGALALGMLGQVVYHLLAAAHASRAPWPVTVLVSCLPVVTLGFGAALTHLLRTPAEAEIRHGVSDLAPADAKRTTTKRDPAKSPSQMSDIDASAGAPEIRQASAGFEDTAVPEIGADRADLPDASADASDPVTVRARLNGHAAKSEKVFAADLEAGRIPGQRRIQAQLHVGQPKARLVQQHLRNVIETR